MIVINNPYIYILLGGNWLPFGLNVPINDLGISNHPNWRTKIFFSGVAPTTKQLFFVGELTPGPLTITMIRGMIHCNPDDFSHRSSHHSAISWVIGGFRSHRGTPSHHPFRTMGFSITNHPWLWKPPTKNSFWTSWIFGQCHMTKKRHVSTRTSQS